jgi:forkhead box protein N
MAPDNDKPGQDESDSHMRQRLVNSLSQSFPGSALSRALKLMDPLDECDGDLDPLSSSCFAEIHLDKEPVDDDELTSLSWLQDSDLLKNMNAGEDGTVQGDGQKENNDGIKLEPKDGAPQMHPPHVPYNPQKHINSKPPYSFSCLIFMAIEDSLQKRLPVKDIYSWILTHFPYFQNAPTGWKNSVRHNLSLNKCFKKVDKEKGQVSMYFL